MQKDVFLMKVTIYTDGAARNNSEGPGGYGAVIIYTDKEGMEHKKELSAGFDKTTNNRMELMGAIAAFENLNRPCEVDFFSDSKYLTDAFNLKWIEGWKSNGWKNSKKDPVKNRELWERLLEAIDIHTVKWNWVKGHDGNEFNELCDKLATEAADSLELFHDDGGDLKNITINKKIIKETSREKVVEKIEIKYIDDEMIRLDYIEGKSDWIDLRCSEDIDLKQGEWKLIPLGVAMRLPKGYEAHIVPRSSTFKNFGIIQTNHMGVIDSSYSGDDDWWRLPALAMRDTHISKNERICQFRIVKNQPAIEFEIVDHLDEKNRGGFGSTGVL